MKKVRIIDIAEIKNGSTPSTKVRDNYDGNIIWITPKDLSKQNHRFIFRGEKTITQKGYNSCSTTLIPKGSILLSSRAPIGLLAIADVECCTNQGFKNLILNKEKIDNKWFYYYLKLRINEIEALGSGTTFKELSKTNLENFEIDIPDLQTQSAIARVLSSFDDKIELNNTMNKELENLARTIYEYWFVQNADEKWERKKIGEIAETGSGGTPLTSNKEYYENGNIPWINSNELNFGYILDTKNFITQKGLNNSSAKLFPANSILIALYGATAGKVSLLTFQATTNQAICAIMPTSHAHKYYLKFYLSNLYKYFNRVSSGSARDNLSQELIRNLEITLPDTAILEKFNKTVSPIFEQIIKNSQENAELSQLRDFLLPLLMNGQVKISNNNKNINNKHTDDTD